MLKLIILRTSDNISEDWLFARCWFLLLEKDLFNCICCLFPLLQSSKLYVDIHSVLMWPIESVWKAKEEHIVKKLFWKMSSYCRDHCILEKNISVHFVLKGYCLHLSNKLKWLNPFFTHIYISLSIWNSIRVYYFVLMTGLLFQLCV